MDFQKTTISIIAVLIALFIANLVSARERYFNVPRPDLSEISVSEINDEEGGVSLTNDISVSASSGGNSASGGNSSNAGNGQSGGTVSTGSVKAEVRVKTEVNGEVVEDINEKYEGEAEIEKEFENASGTVKTKIKVEVKNDPQPATDLSTSINQIQDESFGANNRQQEDRKIREKRNWFLKIWPFGDDDLDEDDSRNEEERDDFVGTSSPKMSVKATTTATTTNNLSASRNIKEAIRSFFKNLFSVFGF